MEYPRASALVLFGIPVLAALVTVLLVLGVAHSERALGAPRRAVLGRSGLAALGVGVWAGLSLLLAAHGVLRRFDARPPPLLVLLLVTLLGAAVLGRSRAAARLARGLPLWALVGFEAFRLPLELVLHRAARDGTMPIEMSFSGYNFDIVTGASAAVIALALAPRATSRLTLRVVWLWNALGILLLLNIVAIAIAATPVFHAFGANHLDIWVTEPPFVLLPSILVMAALFGHALVYRKLAQLRAESALCDASAAQSSINASGTGSKGLHHPRLGTARGKG